MNQTGEDRNIGVRRAEMTAPWLNADHAPGPKGLSHSQAQLQVLTDAMPQMVWSTLPDGFHDYYNARWYEFTGMPPGSTDGDGWNGVFHPDDQARAWRQWRHSLETGEPYEIEYRLRHRSGQYRWTLGRALPVRDDAGAITRWIGTCTDIDDAKRAAEQNELLSRELSHRIKNIFAVISGLVHLSSRHDPGARAFARSLLQRISALGRAHEFARPHSEASRPPLGASTLQGLLGEIFSPYTAYDEGRIVISGDDVGLDQRGATPIALVFHELATNAAKYGALSCDTGRVLVTVAIDQERVVMRWSESGGPPVHGPPLHSGFGTTLADLSIAQQLEGRIERSWRPEGLAVEMSAPVRNLASQTQLDLSLLS